jgi:DUF1680 family protein
VMVTRHYRNFDVNHDGTDVCYGLFTGYACCTSNMHQGWPKFTQNLWYATPDGGLAALVYAPCVVTTFLGEKQVAIVEETNYPFDEKIRFQVKVAVASVDLRNPASATTFPFKLRIPSWCDSASVLVNGMR